VFWRSARSTQALDAVADRLVEKWKGVGLSIEHGTLVAKLLSAGLWAAQKPDEAEFQLHEVALACQVQPWMHQFNCMVLYYSSRLSA
jgi:hypothetical protein